MISLPEKLIFPVPFAGGEGAALTPIVESTTENKVNFKKGFPSVYSSPNSLGGKYVTRGELNAIGNLATKNDYYRMCGGINTFDPVFASKIGGYPKDAILDYFDGVNLFKVISLEENNMVDFRSGVFGGKWAKLGTNDTITGRVLLDTFTDYQINFSSTGFVFIGQFIATKSGIVTTKVTSYNTTDSDSETSGAGKLEGTAFLGHVFNSVDSVVAPTITLSNYQYHANYNGYAILPGLPSSKTVLGGVSPIVYPKTTPLIANRGDLICIYAQNGFSNIPTGGSSSSGYNLAVSFEIYIS